MINPRYPVLLKEKTLLAPGIMELSYVREDGGRISYVPGQFFSLDFDYQGEAKSRSYSAAGVVPDMKANKEFLFAISAVPNGAASDYFFHASPGDPVKMSGPYGAFILPQTDPHRYLLLATGTGITPYRAMLPELEKRLQKNSALEVLLVVGVRSKQELIYHNEFLAMAQAYPGFSFHVCYSRQKPEVANNYEHVGRIQGYLDTLEIHPDQDMVYLCGNPFMVDELSERFAEHGFPAGHIKKERYKFSAF